MSERIHHVTLYEVYTLKSKTFKDGVLIPLRSHETQYIRSNKKTDQIIQEFKDKEEFLIEVKVKPISQDEFENMTIRLARQKLKRSICTTDANFGEVYYSEKYKDPVQYMTQWLVDNTISWE